MFLFFFFNDTATTEIYTLSLHDALPIYFKLAGFSCRIDDAAFDIMHDVHAGHRAAESRDAQQSRAPIGNGAEDRKSTRLNSSHANISYAVFCLKKKKTRLYVRTILISYI